MEDLRNIRITAKADSIIEELQSRFLFKTAQAAERFALVYALKNYRDKIDFESLDATYKSDGTNQNTATIDTSNNLFQKLICIIYPKCETPYRYIRVAIIFGLYKIDELMKESDFSFESLFNS